MTRSMCGIVQCLKPVVSLNNNCSKGPGRNLFIDVLGDDRSRAARLEKNIRDFVAGGKGLTAIHGAIVCFNNSPEFSDMLGGSFDFHPAQQKVTLDLVERNRGVCEEGEEFRINHWVMCPRRASPSD